MMARAKRIYVLIIRVNKLFSFLSLCFLKEIESMFSMFLSRYRNICESERTFLDIVNRADFPVSLTIIPFDYLLLHKILTDFSFSTVIQITISLTVLVNLTSENALPARKERKATALEVNSTLGYIDVHDYHPEPIKVQ